MKERPILFSAPMVRALLAGTKTQMRRVVKGDVEDVRPPDWYDSRRLVHKATCQRGYCENVEEGELACGGYDLEANGVGPRSPYGAPGDRLWVRETWYCDDFTVGDYSVCDDRQVLENTWRENGADSWAKNPWVWAITFRRLP